MMKKRMKALLAIGLSAIIMVCSAGCGNGKEHMKAETRISRWKMCPFL